MTESETARVIFDALIELRHPETEAGAAFVAMRLTEAAKREAFEFGLQQFPAVLVMFDPRAGGVHVPEAHRAGPTLSLRFGLNLRPSLYDLVADRDGISCTLAFGGRPYHCVIPWRAVFAIKSEQGDHWLGVWHDSIPEDKKVVSMTGRNDKAAAQPAASAKSKRPHLSLVPMPDDDGGEA